MQDNEWRKTPPKLELNGWQPIESAPIDDTPVLIWDAYGMVAVGWRVSPSEWEYASGDEDSYPSRLYGKAWMPLPPQPYFTADESDV